MADFVVSTTYQDNLSAGMNAATDAMNKAADAADKLDQTVTKAGPSATALATRYDAATKSAAALQRAQDQLRQATATMDAGVASGTVTVAQRNAVVDSLSAKVQALTAATANAGPVSDQMTAAHGRAAGAANVAAAAHAGFTRELVVLGHEVVSGNFSRIPGSMVVLAERSGELNNIVSTLGNLLFGLPGIALAAGAALVAVGYSSETSQRQILALQTALRATRDDFTAMATEANNAAKAVAATTGFSSTDTRAAAQSISSVPSFVGDQQQLQALIVEAGDLAAVMGETLPAAATKLAQAMQDPAKAAQDLADTHFRGMNQATADAIALQAAAGDKAGAFAKYLDVVKASTSGAADASKTELQLALENLSKAFTGTGADGQSFADVLGRAVTGAASAAVNALAAVVKGINDARAAINTGPGSGTGNINGSVITPGLAGNVLTSSAGALGIFQLMPQTAAGLHVDPTDAQQNIYGGLSYIQQLQQQYNGNTAAMLAQYGGYGHDTTAAAGYINKVQNADTSVLNGQNVMIGGQVMTTAQAIQFWGESLGLDQNTINLGMRIATVESGGRQFVSATSAVATNGTPSAASGDESLPIPPIPPAGDANGLANTDLINQALQKADKSGTPASAAASAAADVKLYTDALNQLSAAGDTSSDTVLKLQQALQKAQVAEQDAIQPAQNLLNTLGRQVQGENDITAAYADGMAAVDHMTNVVKAEQEARQYAAQGTVQYIAIVQALTAAYDSLTASQQSAKAAQTEFDQQQQLDYLNAQLSTLTETADQRARDLAAMKERQTIEATMPGLEQAEKDKLVANAEAIADATTQLQKQQQAISEVGNMVTQVADQLGQAITNAFVSGQGAAVNWGNVTKAIIASVVQEMLKLAVINPILNSVLGDSKTTLGDVTGLLGGSSGSGGILSSLTGGSNLLSALGIASNGAIGDAPVGGVIAGLNADGSVAGTGGLLNTSLFGSGTIGSAIGGVGLGFGAGSAVGGLVQNATGHTGPGATAGAAVGALAGAAIGSIIPGVGTVIGGLIGGIIGGGGGGLIGPAKPHSYAVGGVGAANGQLTLGGLYSQVMDGTQEFNTLQGEVNDTNAFLAQNGVQISSYAGNTVGVSDDNNLPPDLYTADPLTGKTPFSQMEFSSADSAIESVLSGQSFQNLTELETAVQNVETFVNTTVPALLALGQSPTANGTLTTQINNLNTEFGAAITQAQKLGMATDDLSAAWTYAVNSAQSAADKQTNQMDQGFQANYLSALATVTGNPQDAENAQLYAFDSAASQQRDQLDQYLIGLYGDSYRTSQGYADQMAALEKSLGEQRLAIQQQYNDKLTATAETGVQSLASYVAKLQTGSTSPLSPMDQYGLASTQFNTDVAAAQNGDWNAYSGITGYADTLLQTSQAVNGSGTAYVADFNRVLDALQSLASETPDTLTASIYSAEMQTQTQQLSDSMAQVKAAVDSLRLVVQQGSTAPARLTS